MKPGNRARVARGWLFVIDKKLWWGLYLLCPLLFTACQHTQPHYADTPPASTLATSGGVSNVTMTPIGLENQLDPSCLKPPTQLFTLGPGDKVEIEVLGETNSNVITVVGPDGRV